MKARVCLQTETEWPGKQYPEVLEAGATDQLDTQSEIRSQDTNLAGSSQLLCLMERFSLSAQVEDKDVILLEELANILISSTR